MSRGSKNRMRRHLQTSENGSRSMFSDCQRMTENAIRHSPVVATLAMFGLGLGIGTIVGSMLAASDSMPAFTRRSRYLPRKGWLESMTGALPSAIRSHLPS